MLRLFFTRLLTAGTSRCFSAASMAFFIFSMAFPGSRCPSGRSPGSTALTKAVMARPSLQSVVKLFTGIFLGILLVTHASKACFGLILSSLLLWPLMANEIWYFKIKLHIKPSISFRFPLLMFSASVELKRICFLYKYGKWASRTQELFR